MALGCKVGGQVVSRFRGRWLKVNMLRGLWPGGRSKSQLRGKYPKRRTVKLGLLYLMH